MSWPYSSYLLFALLVIRSLSWPWCGSCPRWNCPTSAAGALWFEAAFCLLSSAKSFFVGLWGSYYCFKSLNLVHFCASFDKDSCLRIVCLIRTKFHRFSHVRECLMQAFCYQYSYWCFDVLHVLYRLIDFADLYCFMFWCLDFNVTWAKNASYCSW